MKIYRYNGKKNMIGANVRKLRKALRPAVNQRQLAERLQLMGYEFDRHTINRIEKGTRFVADYEVMALAGALDVDIGGLYRDMEKKEEDGNGEEEG